MPNTTINIEFPEYKLKAIEQALQEKSEPKSVQDLLLEHTEGLYQKHVPAQARKYLDSLLGEPSQEQTAPAPESQAAAPRQNRRRVVPESNEQGPAPAPEQTQEMTMSMQLL